jgi:gliding motility-associated-like protein
MDVKISFKYPLEVHEIVANPDKARISWDQDTTINVLANDRSTVKLIPGTVHVTIPPSRGGAKANSNGTITYSPGGRFTGTDHFNYEVCDTLDFCAETSVTIDIFASGIKVPEAFSPNGDGANDQLVFPDLPIIYPKSQLYVYTRSGQLVFQSIDYDNKWDGRMANQQLVPTGTYYYVLKLGRTNQAIKGFVYIGY